ncbi:uncharacterized protein LACBIDRAFT_333605 [Laccaria bicolor S238N-H82]|uniref:Predicted protein n=1 Tax=Laccaria bicolor (strain S238N-H82 / ATCC MYA-4686) TaxID=486041 RepID=B0DWH4_LACBS|nr:uncharacterized protein LACBIDRAFT_333605 [Laccaria bicolor S238N-H82]EDR01091.1 predicted protein [Laccaria bicolor S238N-H82]|eukprot:XP_001888310.1 predicted protein [Laccaria bicolor S238N-H82]
MHELKFATIHEVGDQSVFHRMRQRSTDMTTTAWCGMLGAPVRTLVARSFPAPECAEISTLRPSRRDISFPHKTLPSVRTAGVKVVGACFPVAATCYVLGLGADTNGTFTHSHTLPDNRSRQILTAEGLYNSMSMIGSDCGFYPTFTSRTSTFQASSQVTTPNGPTVQRAGMLPGARSSLFKIDAISRQTERPNFNQGFLTASFRSSTQNYARTT